MKSFILLCLSYLVLQSSAIYFYLDKGVIKCFKDDIVSKSVPFLPLNPSDGDSNSRDFR